jgi:hypothetical protein
MLEDGAIEVDCKQVKTGLWGCYSVIFDFFLLGVLENNLLPGVNVDNNDLIERKVGDIIICRRHPGHFTYQLYRPLHNVLFVLTLTVLPNVQCYNVTKTADNQLTALF